MNNVTLCSNYVTLYAFKVLTFSGNSTKNGNYEKIYLLSNFIGFGGWDVVYVMRFKQEIYGFGSHS